MDFVNNMNNSRRRTVSSCLPCYTRKQKCSREIPCNHCTRRKCPEACVYTFTAVTSTNGSVNPALLTEPPHVSNGQVNGHTNGDLQQQQQQQRPHAADAPLSSEVDASHKQVEIISTIAWPGSTPATALTESLGYSQHSTRNILALFKKLGLGESSALSNHDLSDTPDALDEVSVALAILPDRRILNFLVHFFVNEVAWMDQLVCVRWFLAKYEAHASKARVETWAAVEFTILTLRICSYASQFLPSPTYPLDRIHGVLLADIRYACDEIADRLQAARQANGGPGTLLTVQQLAFAGLRYQAEGKIDKFWELLGQAIRVALHIGIHRDTMPPQEEMTSAEQTTMARWVVCNLYVWDSQMMRQLDCIPAMPDHLCPRGWLTSQLSNGGCGSNDDGSRDNDLNNNGVNSVKGPDPFIERLQQTRLAALWRSVSSQPDVEYDVMEAEERYDRFCREFLPGLPPCLALVDPDEGWDQRHSELPLQRQLLHTAIYDWTCWNFRPLLLWRPTNLPAYKAVLVLSQKKALAAAALQALDSVSRLHTLLGNRHTRLAGIAVSTFEATVALLTLLMDPVFPEPCIHTQPRLQPQSQQRAPSGSNSLSNWDPLQAAMHKVTRATCFQAARIGLSRLQMLAEMSSLAEQCAAAIVQLLGKVSEAVGDNCPQNPNPERLNKRSRQEFSSASVTDAPVSSTHGHSTLVAGAGSEMTSWLPTWSEPLSYPHDATPDPAPPAPGGATTVPWSSTDTPAAALSNPVDYLTDHHVYYY